MISYIWKLPKIFIKETYTQVDLAETYTCKWIYIMFLYGKFVEDAEISNGESITQWFRSMFRAHKPKELCLSYASFNSYWYAVLIAVQQNLCISQIIRHTLLFRINWNYILLIVYRKSFELKDFRRKFNVWGYGDCDLTFLQCDNNSKQSNNLSDGMRTTFWAIWTFFF